ncbi:MAG: hypothetical protein RSG07_05680 [Erysipelotrichaceae bacterium]
MCSRKSTIFVFILSIIFLGSVSSVQAEDIELNPENSVNQETNQSLSDRNGIDIFTDKFNIAKTIINNKNNAELDQIQNNIFSTNQSKTNTNTILNDMFSEPTIISNKQKEQSKTNNTVFLILLIILVFILFIKLLIKYINYSNKKQKSERKDYANSLNNNY